jgi:hypothetical protein
MTVNTDRNSLANRRDHPTYGYSKAMIRADLARLTALAEAYYLVTCTSPPAGRPLFGSVAAAAAGLGVNLIEAANAVRDMT